MDGPGGWRARYGPGRRDSSSDIRTRTIRREESAEPNLPVNGPAEATGRIKLDPRLTRTGFTCHCGEPNRTKCLARPRAAMLGGTVSAGLAPAPGPADSDRDPRSAGGPAAAVHFKFKFTGKFSGRVTQ